MAGAAEELVATGVPTAAEVAKLIDHLKQPEPALREAAIKRLTAHRAIAATPAVEALAKGNLATRLSALELLMAWKAPVGSIDPWKPESITEERLKALREWAKGTSTTRPATQPAALAPDDLRQARLELAKLMETAAESEVQTIRERLARLGGAIAPEVQARLKATETEPARQRLDALRYRLAMSDALALAWPGGVEQLASSDAETRRAGVVELQKRATAQESGLLLELFADPDPVVRQISLRTLGTVAGKGATEPLLGLLSDPDPNVRAEVLKQLMEKPVLSAVGKVADYAVAENSVDLVVHAVRVFRAAGGNESREVLLKLTDHQSWRVRAEAVEALQEIANASRGQRQHDPEVQAALMKLLKDKDGFVVSRAAMMLLETSPAAALEPVIAAVEAHPELAADVLQRIGNNAQMKARAPPHLIKLAANPDPAVRAAAVRGLGSNAANAGQVIAKALHDADEGVRVAGAEATFAAMEELRPADGMAAERKREGMVIFNGRPQIVERVDTSRWLSDFRSGKGRPAWMADAAGDLSMMLESQSQRERMSAAQALVALGKEERALPMLLEAAKSGAQWRKTAADVLPWLAVERRLEVFGQLWAMAGDDEQKGALVEAMAGMPDRRVRGPLWQILSGNNASGALTNSVYAALLKLYLTQNYYILEQVPKAMVTEAIRETRERAQSGPDVQRVVALAILLTASKSDAAEVAGKIYRDTATSEVLREDALLVLLRATQNDEAAKQSAEALASKQDGLRSLALAHLTGDDERLSTLRLGPQLSHSTSVGYVGQETPANLAPPAGLKEEMLRPFVKAGGREGARAAYLLALMGRDEAVDLLLKQWRDEAAEEWDRLVYRAVTALNDEKYVPVLEEIYAKMDKTDYRMREFYWTIRTMSGPRILALRKRIRDEVGMDKLR
jgi:HEAT repeat protein